jgi:outer membrane protein, heavy metal efflux system
MRRLCQALIAFVATLGGVERARAQESPHEFVPGQSTRERPAPGHHSPYDNQRGGAIIGGRPGSMRPRVPLNTRPGGAPQTGPVMPLPPPVEEPSAVPMPNPWAILFELADEGPSTGLTLDQAIDRLVGASINLKAKSLDIPQAQADVLTAGMHANPVVYLDGQLIPYRAYNTTTNPGGPTQYDLNFAYPVDLSGKRQARIEVANAAQRVVEALYQDSVRLEIARLGDVYVDALAARLALRTTRGGLARVEEIQRRTAQEKHDPAEAESLRRQLHLQRQTLLLAVIEAEAAWKNSQRTLSTLLNLPFDAISSLELHGTVLDKAPPPPVLKELLASAVINRPDVVAYRLGLQRAEADVRLSKANRLPDVYALYQPVTYQDNAPFGLPSSRSWAAGATVTVPLFDRNQGNIRRAQVNVEQTQLELRNLEQRASSEVQAAFDDYFATLRGLRQIEQELLPEINREHTESLQKFQQGKLDAAGLLSARRDADDLGRQYRELLIRHRRSMLDLNAAVGTRVLP